MSYGGHQACWPRGPQLSLHTALPYIHLQPTSESVECPLDCLGHLSMVAASYVDWTHPNSHPEEVAWRVEVSQDICWMDQVG